ncbi:MAG: putative dehydrogenase [Pirellulaceae bacterium]|jgi:predicted dehydrogenase
MKYLQNNMNVSRRQFNQGGLAAMIASGMAPLMIGRAQADEPKKQLGLAIVGLGGYATRSIAPEIAACQHVRLAGVVTGDAEKGKTWAKEHGFEQDAIYSYDSFDKIASDDRIDFVHIALPNSMHAEFAIRAAKAGKHVMVEKPMAVSSQECEKMIAAAKQAGVLLGVNYRLHWEPHHVQAVLRCRALGNLSNGNYEFSWAYARALTGPNKDKVKKWLLDPKMAGGGVLFDTGVYPIQAACYLTGREPVAVRGLPATRHPDLFPEGIEETMSYELLFDDGFQALCRASYSQSFHQCTTLGPKGSVEILPGQKGSVFGQSGTGNPKPKRLFVNKKEIELKQTLQQAVLLDAFAVAVKNGEKAFKTPGEMGLRDIRIVEKIYESAAKGGLKVSLI